MKKTTLVFQLPPYLVEDDGDRYVSVSVANSIADKQKISAALEELTDTYAEDDSSAFEFVCMVTNAPDEVEILFGNDIL